MGPKTKQLLEEKIEYIYNFVLGKNSSKRTQKAQTMKILKMLNSTLSKLKYSTWKPLY